MISGRLGAALRRFGVEAASLAVVALAIAGISLGAASWKAETESTVAAQAQATAANLSRLLAEKWRSTIAEIDVLLDSAAEIGPGPVAGDPTSQLRLDRLRRQIARAGAGADIHEINGADAAGNVNWSTGALSGKSINIADRSYFKAIQAGADSFVDSAAIGRVSGLPEVHFARAIRAEGEPLAGMVVAGVNTSVLDRLTSELRSSGSGVIAILRSDRVVIARSPSDGVGMTLALTPLLRQLLAEGRVEGLYVSQIDHRANFFAGQRIPHSDLYLLVGLDHDERMAPARQAASAIDRFALIADAAVIATAVLAVILIRRSQAEQRERRHAEALHQRDSLLRELAQHAGDVLGLLDHEFRNIFISPSGFATLGADPATVIGRRFGGRIVPEDQPIAEAALARVKAEGAAQRVTVRTFMADGKIGWLEQEILRIAPEDPSDPDSVRYVVIARDVTGRMRAEEEKRMAERDRDDFVRLGGGLLYRVIDVRGAHRIRAHSLVGGVTWLGFSAAQIGTPGFLAGIAGPATTAAREAAVTRCLATGRAVVEYTLPDSTSQLHWLRDDMIAYDTEGEGISIVGYVTDITGERQARMRMQQAERLATLGSVSTGLAHEINQPLATIAMAAANGERLAADLGEPAEGLRAKFARIERQAHRAARIVALVRNFGRGAEKQATAISLADLVADILPLVEDRLNHLTIRLELDLPADLPPLRGTPVLLSQVVLNLVVNACDAHAGIGEAASTPAAPSHAGEKTIRVSGRVRDGRLLIRIADNAGGIPEPTLQHIFEPFFSTKPENAGTGLGLSISAATIADLGGRLTARNEDGGAVFEIDLPVPADPPTEPSPKPIAPALAG